MGRRKKLFRFRKRSMKTALGVTKAKRRIKSKAGVYKATKIINAPKNAKRRIIRKAGYESGIMKLFRFLKRKSRK